MARPDNNNEDKAVAKAIGGCCATAIAAILLGVVVGYLRMGHWGSPFS